MKRYDKELVAFAIIFTYTLIAVIVFNNVYARICEAVACIGSVVMIIYLSYLHYHHDKHQEKSKTGEK